MPVYSRTAERQQRRWWERSEEGGGAGCRECPWLSWPSHCPPFQWVDSCLRRQLNVSSINAHLICIYDPLNPLKIVKSGQVLISNTASGETFKSVYTWFGPSILGLVQPWSPKIVGECGESRWVSVGRTLEIWEAWYCYLLWDFCQVSGPFWSSVYLSVKWTWGEVSLHNVQGPFLHYDSKSSKSNMLWCLGHDMLFFRCKTLGNR